MVKNKSKEGQARVRSGGKGNEVRHGEVKAETADSRNAEGRNGARKAKNEICHRKRGQIGTD